MSRRKKRKLQLGAIRACVCTVCLALVLLMLNGLEKLVDFGIERASAAALEEQPETEVVVETEPVIIETETETEPQPTLTLKVCVDAGHGGMDGGAEASDGSGRLEKDDNLRLALALQAYLESKNVEVVMTRTDDTFVELSDRANIANQAGVNYFISLHRNTGEGNGVEVWVHSQATEGTEGMQYGSAIMEALDAAGITRNRGVKNGSQSSADSNLLVNRETTMPSCLVELGFMGYAEDNTLFDQNLESYAAGMGDAIINTWLTLHPEEMPQTAAPENTGGGSMDAEGNVTSIHIENPQIDLNGLSTELVEWGSGGPTDDLKRPDGCKIDQEKYGKYNAYFYKPSEDETDKVVYLTFDIGYTNEYTTSILDTLKEKGVKAVFFATLPVVQDEPDICNRIISEGHELGNHSVTHTNIVAKSIEEQQRELLDVHEAALNNYGYEMHLWRYPEGKFSEQGLAIVNNCNYRSVFWSFAHHDWVPDAQPDVATAKQSCIDSLHPGAIYLLHGISSTNAALLGDFIDAAIAQGYRFELLQ